MKTMMTWGVVEGPGPEWKRAAGLSDDGRVFLPAALFGNESSLFFSASWDGVGPEGHLYQGHIFMDAQGHIFMDAEWLAKELPDLSAPILDVAKKIAKKLSADAA